MTRRSIFNVFLTLIAVFVLAAGVLAQGKHGGKKQGGHGNPGGGKQHKQWNGDRGGGPQKQKQWNGNRGNGNDRGNAWAQKRGNDHAARQFIRQQQRQQHVVQRQQHAIQRQQQRQINVFQRQQQRVAQEQLKQQRKFRRDQQRQFERVARDQRRYQQRQYRDAIREYRYDNRRRHDNGRHNGWINAKPRGNHFGWYDRGEKQYRKAVRKARRENFRRYDPVVTFVPAYYDAYRYRPRREVVYRSIISTFFTPETVYYQYYPAPRTYSVYQPYQPEYYETVAYSPAYDYYEPGYDYYDPYEGSVLFGDGDLQSSLLNIGFELLQGFLGQGYLDGLEQGTYVREVYGPRYADYYNPYEAPAEYYSPYVSCFADQRQLFDEGYRLGYEDGLRDRDPYAAFDGGVDNVDLISAFLTNSFVGNI